MLDGALSNITSAVFGTIIGSVGTWYVGSRRAHVDRCHKSIETASVELQDYRVVYAQLFAEYMSPEAAAAGRHWAQRITKEVDMNYLELQRRVDVSRGRLRVHLEVLQRILPANAAHNAAEAIRHVLRESSHFKKATPDCVDQYCDAAMDALLDLLPHR